MNINDLNKEYDKMQKKYGSKELNSIYNGGYINKPNVLFIFMNPTGRNNASQKDWKGQRYPWIGSKNIWKLFFNVGLLDKTVYDQIQQKKTRDWDEKFAEFVYDNVKKHKYFITNLGKCTQVDARPLPDTIYQKYLELLYKEIDIIKPEVIITFGNQVSSIFLNENIQVSKCRKKQFKKKIKNIEYEVYPTFYPVGNGMRNIDKTISDVVSILKK
ncbi:MAG: uracil-DNA glycosylase family protein [Bacilli bacterium]|nr:uracil-DNA glycosylase family protein [Bacilli bacterium]MDD4718266.1 uracil-DNA glycosylase family protein [Bacilli bacterium]